MAFNEVLKVGKPLRRPSKKRGSGYSGLLKDEQRHADEEELGVCMWCGDERKKDGLQEGLELECLPMYFRGGESRQGRLQEQIV